MRTVRTEDIIKNIKEMCIEANHFLSEDMRQVFEQSVEAEKSPLGSLVLNQLKENLEIAGKDDPYLPGYRYGGRIYESGTGRTYRRGKPDRRSQ